MTTNQNNAIYTNGNSSEYVNPFYNSQVPQIIPIMPQEQLLPPQEHVVPLIYQDNAVVRSDENQQPHTNTQNQQKILNFFIKKYSKEKDVYATAAYYYTVLYKLYFITTTILMSIVSILSFVVASNVFSKDTNTWVSLSTGIISIVGTTIYNLSVGFKLQVKLDQFNQSNIDFDDLLTELSFKKYDHDETCAHILKDIEVTIAKIKNRNKFAIPKIVSIFIKRKQNKN